MNASRRIQSRSATTVFAVTSLISLLFASACHHSSDAGTAPKRTPTTQRAPAHPSEADESNEVTDPGQVEREMDQLEREIAAPANSATPPKASAPPGSKAAGRHAQTAAGSS